MSTRIIFVLCSILLAAAPALAQPAPKPGAVPAKPAVTQPARPATIAPPAPAAMPGAQSQTNVAGRASLVATAFSEAAFKAANDSGNAVIIIFSSAQDVIWEKQASVLQSILREPEFNRTPTFQIDMANPDVAEKFQVKAAGTILVFKAGAERLRSSRMIKADAIRKMLRLQSVL